MDNQTERHCRNTVTLLLLNTHPKGADNGRRDAPSSNGAGGIHKTQVQPTKLKGWAAALSGFILSFLGALVTWFAGLPSIVQAAIFIGGGLVTSTLVVAVIWIKNQREERAAKKELEIIKAGGVNV